MPREADPDRRIAIEKGKPLSLAKQPLDGLILSADDLAHRLTVERLEPERASRMATAGMEAGIEACVSGQADWCQGCDTPRYRHDMRWLHDLYRCQSCLGPGIGTPALWVDPWKDDVIAQIPLLASVPKYLVGWDADWGSSRTVRG